MASNEQPGFMVTRTLGRIKRQVRKIPGMQALRYWLALRFGKRNYYAFTQFLRLPTQYQALVGPVLAHLRENASQDSLRIIVIGCSIGAEPYSIASALLTRDPDLPFRIDAYDIALPLLEKATHRTYTETEVLGNRLIPVSFVEQTFEKNLGGYIVKPIIAERVHFRYGDVLSPDFVAEVGQADMLFAQNILLNLTRPTARRALKQIACLWKPRAAVFLDGTDLDIRTAFARRHGLRPLDFKIEQIHNEARIVRGPRWPYSPTGLEQFNRKRRNWREYYATVFLCGDSDIA